ncbi:NFX1-type zinc finger-containing protein 1-like [Metopolophium dirhodum]|uniref:NFX1-type zinc finger-containing protein 1-like n=1 Tax=Metopolophium dirhodum TaxID=44670 RepID=UPI002990326E|nr:NFX1-type zinc finger-containing protein 1-like [Metopolophium dirhodum]XP_060875366.1 NFX1-type zinc finger-containing protein 1-like [Metopolophium dirhodum]XP_060875367.1 NFX1-type zinc finger-containing protein 1-like [Metopolophium dirhodum]XP_060875368.1 NFX1-type zinc finger-containing protein 1-like [Metopolophium dirhodum]
MTKKKKQDYTLEYKWLENDLSKSSMLTSVSRVDMDDYRCIPLYPTLEDITDGPPKLCANHVNRPYKNCDEYLNNFFRLMREDFVSVIRDTLKTYKRGLDIDTMWYYANVKIEMKRNSSVTMFFRFDTPCHAKAFNYENSKRFKNGALLLLSKDKFTTFSLGIITDTFRLNKGIVGVDVVDFEEVNKWISIDLLEPQVFYEPYRYVLGVFQDLCETNFPMKNYIIHGLKEISYPSYLANNSIYTINGITFDILQNDQWPSAEILNMDINQYEAFKGALTKEFVMIQGPPGTGKTYIGLEIVKIIIENMYDTNKIKHPIMVVCMTNHALDQFLEGIWKITRNISRFGRGTKSDILVNYIPNMSVARKDECANIYVDAKRNVKTSIQKENEHLFNIKEVDRNEGVVDLSLLIQVLDESGFNTWFQDSYDLLAWLLHDISAVDGINPIDFIKKDKLLVSQLSKSNKNEANKKVYFITLKSIKLYCTRIQCQLNGMSQKDDEVPKKQDLEHALKIMKTVEDYIVKHLKLYKSRSENYKIQNNRDLLEKRDRWLLYYNWVRLYLTKEYNSIENMKDTTRQCRRDMNKFKSIGYLKPVQNKYVIGMTTTAAAKNRYLLKNLKCPIVIIEEAAEVLEPHIVASLSEYCEHVILIGDHKQLRPQTANHIIGKKYRLDISLFERMVNNEIPSYVLAEQHRMRPEIAGLVAPTIYPHLRNHASVMERPHVKGVGMNIFCMTHNVHEEKSYELSSFVNSVEANYLVALADYLLKQGYYPEDITIMAMYNAQVIYISNLINSPPFEHLANIRVSSVDAYQGEENEIVLLSLVRSNNNHSIGFLKTNNRVCVALSRARLGFYMAGDLKLLARASKLWNSIKKYLCSLNALGPKLLLKCQIHNKVIGSASSGLDFQKFTGCQLKCNVKLSCGHLCKELCHIEDSGHLMVKCSNVCNRKCPRDHQCRQMCHEECSCQELINEITNCGHIVQGKCSDIENMKCDIKVKKLLSCGHTLEKKCYEQFNCIEVCNKPNSNCLFRHLCKKPCGVNCGLCTYPIPIIMKCGHISEFSCSQEPDTVECLECKVNQQGKKKMKF